MKKPKWVVQKERDRKASSAETVWLFGLHAVRDAIANPAREKLRLVVTKNAADKLSDVLGKLTFAPEVVETRQFDVPIDRGSVHQGAALEVRALEWEPLDVLCTRGDRVVLLDRVTDPHNVGAILRSAEVFGAVAVIAPVSYTHLTLPTIYSV